MPIYQCHFLDESKSVVRIENLGHCGDDREAGREARRLMMRVGHFCGYELWEGDRMVDVYVPVKLDPAL